MENDTLKRITPDEIKAAYNKTGMTVSRGKYFDSKGHDVCGCGVGVYAAAYLGLDPRYYAGRYSDHAVAEALKDAGFHRHYRIGFAEGFDGDSITCKSPHTEEFHLGHADGQAAWEDVKEDAVE